MAQSKKKWVAFKSNVTVPGDVICEDKDQKMQVGEPVQLPEAYANHVVQDGFAAFCDAPKKTGSVSAQEMVALEASAKLDTAQARADDLTVTQNKVSKGHEATTEQNLLQVET